MKKTISQLAEERFDEQTFPRMERCAEHLMSAIDTWETADKERRERVKTLNQTSRCMFRDITAAAYIRSAHRGFSERD